MTQIFFKEKTMHVTLEIKEGAAGYMQTEFFDE